MLQNEQLFAIIIILFFSKIHSQTTQTIPISDFKSGAITTIAYNESIQYNFTTLQDMQNNLNIMLQDINADTAPQSKIKTTYDITIKIETISNITISVSTTLFKNTATETLNIMINKLQAILNVTSP